MTRPETDDYQARENTGDVNHSNGLADPGQSNGNGNGAGSCSPECSQKFVLSTCDSIAALKEARAFRQQRFPTLSDRPPTLRFLDLMGHAWSLEAIARGRGIPSTEGSASADCTAAERELWMRYKTPRGQDGEEMDGDLIEDAEKQWRKDLLSLVIWMTTFPM